MNHEKPVNPVSYEEGAELIRKMKQAQELGLEQGQDIAHIGFMVDPATGEYVRIKSDTEPKVIPAELKQKPEPAAPEFKLESEPAIKPDEKLEQKVEEKKKTSSITKKFDSKLFRVPKRPSTGMADAIKKWQDEHDQ